MYVCVCVCVCDRECVCIYLCNVRNFMYMCMSISYKPLTSAGGHSIDIPSHELLRKCGFHLASRLLDEDERSIVESLR